MLLDDGRPRLNQMLQEPNHYVPLLRRAGHESAISMTIARQVEQENGAIPAVPILRLGKGKPCEGGKIVGKPFRGRKADGVPTRIANVLNAERMKVP